MKKIWITAGSVAFPLLTMAHSGHGSNEGTVLHYITSYWHIVPIAGIVITLFFILKSYRARKNYSK